MPRILTRDQSAGDRDQGSGAGDFSEIIARDGFAFVPAAEMRGLLEQSGSLNDWEKFAASWDDLETDAYMADKGRYRKRRYAVYAATAGGAIKREAHQPHYQSLDYNPLNGGVERWFEPIKDEIGAGDSVTAILEFCRKLFDGLADGTTHSLPPAGRVREGGGKPGLAFQILNRLAKRADSRPLIPDPRDWHIEAHQFRIEAKANKAGKPTPEGMHRDGRDFVLVLLIRRENIASGVTTIHDLAHRQLGAFTLTQPFDAALVDDRRVFHGVTPVTPLDPAKPAYRDVLVVTFKAK